MHPDRLGPRDLRSAALTSAALVVAGTLAMLSSEVTAAMAGESHALPLVGLVSAGLLAVVVAVVLGHHRMPPLLWVALALAMVGVIFTMDVVTDDAGGGAQMAFLFPVVYAGAFLRASAAWLVTGVAAAGHGTLVFLLLPPETALPDMIFGLVVMLGLTAVLTASGRRQDALTRTLRTMASVDLLTGLATRRALETAAEIAPDVAPGRALVLVDVDRFKDLNDAYGHPAGDGVLVHLASVLQSVVRAGDTVARWGGDEIAILMTGIGPDDAVRRAEAVREAVVARPLAHEDGSIALTVSVGVAHSSTAGVHLVSLYAAADEALYGAKRGGRDQVVVGTGATPPGSRTLVR